MHACVAHGGAIQTRICRCHPLRLHQFSLKCGSLHSGHGCSNWMNKCRFRKRVITMASRGMCCVDWESVACQPATEEEGITQERRELCGEGHTWFWGQKRASRLALPIKTQKMEAFSRHISNWRVWWPVHGHRCAVMLVEEVKACERRRCLLRHDADDCTCC